MKRIIFLLIITVSLTSALPTVFPDGVCKAVKQYLHKNSPFPGDTKYISAGEILELQHGSHYAQQVKILRRDMRNLLVVREYVFIMIGDGIGVNVETVLTPADFEKCINDGLYQIRARHPNGQALQKK